MRYSTLLVCGLTLAAALGLGAPRATANGPSALDVDILYEYDRDLPLNAKVVLQEKVGLHTLYKVEYDSVRNERVTALFGVPSNKKGPFPCLMFQHGYGGSKNETKIGLSMLASGGYCIMGIDAQYHGERKKEGKNIFGDHLFQNRDALIQTVVDLRRAYDFLLTRPEVDSKRIGYLGLSMGSILGSLFLGVDQRPAAGILVVGGGGWKEIMGTSMIPPAIRLRSRGELDFNKLVHHFKVVEPLDFIGRYKKPILFLNGKYDNIVPAATGQALFKASTSPKKEVVWYDSGHLVPPEKVMLKVKTFLDKNIKSIPPGPGGIPVPVPKVVQKIAMKGTLKLVNDGKSWPTVFATAVTTPPTPKDIQVELGLEGLGSLKMYDSGREGDPKAGDGIYTYRMQLPYEVRNRKGKLKIMVKNIEGKVLAEQAFDVNLAALKFPKPKSF